MMYTKRNRPLLTAASLLLVLAALLALAPAAQAASSDRSGYRIRQEYIDELLCHYFIYTPEDQRTMSENVLLHAIGPSFCLMLDDGVFYNQSTGGDICIRLYRSLDEASAEKTEAFVNWLAQNERSDRPWQLGWYRFDGGDWPTYYVYQIEGWSQDCSYLDLVTKNSWRNANGERLEIWFEGEGNVIEQSWSKIRDLDGCSTAFWTPVKDFREGATFGFRFIDRNGRTSYKYCEKSVP